MDKIDYSNYHSEPMVSLYLPDSEYQKRLKLRLAMEDVLKAYHDSEDSEELGEAVIEIIEGWEF